MKRTDLRLILVLATMVAVSFLAAYCAHAQDVNNSTLKGTVVSWDTGSQGTEMILQVNGARYLVNCGPSSEWPNVNPNCQLATGSCVEASGYLVALDACVTYNAILRATSVFTYPAGSCY